MCDNLEIIRIWAFRFSSSKKSQRYSRQRGRGRQIWRRVAGGFVHVGGQARSRGAERGFPPRLPRSSPGAAHARRANRIPGFRPPSTGSTPSSRGGTPTCSRGERSWSEGRAVTRLARTRGTGHARRRLSHQARGATPPLRPEGRHRGRRRGGRDEQRRGATGPPGRAQIDFAGDDPSPRSSRGRPSPPATRPRQARLAPAAAAPATHATTIHRRSQHIVISVDRRRRRSSTGTPARPGRARERTRPPRTSPPSSRSGSAPTRPRPTRTRATTRLSAPP